MKFNRFFFVIFLLSAIISPLLFLSIPVSAQCYDEIAPNVKIPCAGFQDGPAGRRSLGGFVQQLIQISLFVIGSVTILFLIIGGFRYITASGNEEQLEAAKSMIKNSIIGLVIVVLSFVIVRVITNFLITGFV